MFGKKALVMKHYEVIVIGGGQAGLAIGHYLKQDGRRFVILEKQSQIGHSWRERYDTLVLFTLRRYSDLPGFLFPGDRDGLPGKDDAANYLESYATCLPWNNTSQETSFRSIPRFTKMSTNCRTVPYW
jgi:cation diffusion facilitator CzcD-associated flavoprotein CzcO